MIRFADKIVGGLIILALGILIFVIFMLGSNQRWFSRDYQFKTYFASASGLSQNMAVQYKGFTIGHVKSVRLTKDDRVEVVFTIFDTYIDRVRTGSLVDVLLSPIGGLGGNQFMFYPGLGTELVPEGETIPSANSSEGKQLLAMQLAERPEQDDSINNIMTRAGTLLGSLNDLVLDVQEAFEGTSRTSLGRTLGKIEVMAEKLPNDLEGGLERIIGQLDPLLINLRAFSEELADPDGSVMAFLASDGNVYTGLASSLEALSSTLRNLEKTSDFIPAQMPQLAVLLAELHVALSTAEDVLVAMTNNPLLKGGVPQRTQTRAGGASDRDVEF
ncbi:MAG: MlaD family protein [Treponema sp.]|jgi:phospholipid/cholesterol/gamma-HCH transport system substrate-binding protein|nr:MlaD family protein [Treponema sp.]